MNEKDKEFIDFIIQERIQTYYESNVSHPTEKEKQDFMDLENGCKQSLALLPIEKSAIIERYYDTIINIMQDESIMYYRSGFMDGYKLFHALMNMVKEENEIIGK